ncbi:hypothetical protein MRB53_037380 [Persea americana]|nr:hypothetical protein MRB53_037380 [Persea americana]
MVEDEEQQYEWNPALITIKDELAFIKRFKGGRLTNLKFKLTHPSELFHARPSMSRSRSSTNTSITKTNDEGEQTSDDKNRPSTPSPRSPNGTLTPSAQTPETRRLSGGWRGRRSRSNSALSPAMAAAGIVAGSIAGWPQVSPVEQGPEDKLPATSAKETRDRSKSDVRGKGKDNGRHEA